MKTIVVVFTFVFSGCFTVAQLQSPKALEKGEIEVGVGTTLTYSENSLDLYESLANLRIGVGDNTDVGFRVFGKIERIGEVGEGLAGWEGWGGVYADIKHQFTEKLPYVSGVLGGSFSIFNIALYPSLIIGTDRFYTSVGAVVMGGYFDKRFKAGGAAARLSIGYSFGGDKVRLTPEIGAVIPLSSLSFDEERRIAGFYTAFGISVRP